MDFKRSGSHPFDQTLLTVSGLGHVQREGRPVMWLEKMSDTDYPGKAQS